jgi:hypothetical protein
MTCATRTATTVHPSDAEPDRIFAGRGELRISSRTAAQNRLLVTRLVEMLHGPP